MEGKSDLLKILKKKKKKEKKVEAFFLVAICHVALLVTKQSLWCQGEATILPSWFVLYKEVGAHKVLSQAKVCLFRCFIIGSQSQQSLLYFRYSSSRIMYLRKAVLT